MCSELNLHLCVLGPEKLALLEFIFFPEVQYIQCAIFQNMRFTQDNLYHVIAETFIPVTQSCNT